MATNARTNPDRPSARTTLADGVDSAAEQARAAPTLVVIDGHALVYRAFHAIPAGFMTSRGEPTNAVFGFTSMLLKVLGELNPEYCCVCFDRSAPTFRHLASTEYKATRPRMSDDLRQQFARVREVVRAFNIPIYELDGYEADDLLGCLTRQAENEGVDSIVVTGDLDSLQLVNEHVRVLAPSRGISETVLYDLEAVRRRYELEPGQIPDFKALSGDASDNIKGVAGIGPKTASRLLAEYGTIEGLYAHLDALNEKQRALLADNELAVRSNKRLTTIDSAAPCILNLEACRLADYDRERVLVLFQELEFRSLLDKLPKQPGQENGATQLGLFDQAAAANGAATTSEATIVRSAADLRGLATSLREAGSFTLYPVAHQESAIDFQVAGIAFSAGERGAWYLPFADPGGETLSEAEALAALKPLLEGEGVGKVAHDAKHVITMLAERGVTLRGLHFDTAVGAYLLNPASRTSSVRELIFQQRGREVPDTVSLAPKGGTLLDVPAALVAPTATEEARLLGEIAAQLEQDLQERAQLALYNDVELPLIPVLSDMERAGIKVDVSVLAEMSRELAQQIRTAEVAIYNDVGHQFTINSPQQLGKVLVEELHLPLTKRTKTGYSTDATVLEELAGVHPVIEHVLTYRQLTKLKSTYIDALPLLINERTGRVHTTFNQTVTSTGRLSSDSPNLQNIPIRTELGRLIRRAFVSGAPDTVLLAADYAQIELRLAAHITGDPLLMEAFLNDEDVHVSTASTVFNVPRDQVTPEQRRLAKTTNFAVLYGISDFGLSQRVGITRDEAAPFIRTYLDRYAGIRAYIDKTIKDAKARGYVETPLGRRRLLPELRAQNGAVRAAGERMAINMPIQGAQADLIKLAMIAVHRDLQEKRLRARMLLQVHDELVLEVPKTELPDVTRLVRERMERAMTLCVPIKVEMKVGPNWYDMERA